MNTITINLTPSGSESGPTCAKCSGPTRLLGIEPHPIKVRTDLRTYRCLVCDHMQASVVPLSA